MPRDIDEILLNKRGWIYTYRELKDIYMSTFKWSGLPDTVSARYIEKYLLIGQQVAFYREPLMRGKKYVCLQSTTVGKLNIYGDPVRSRVYGVNGFSRGLKAGQCVVMWDNLSRMNPLHRLMQFAKRIYDMERTIDVNIAQQRTPRIIKTTKDAELSVKTMLRDVENYKEKIVVLDAFNDYNDVDVVLTPAPFVADLIRIEKTELWHQVLSFIGIENSATEKSERLVSDELIAINALALAKRTSRMEARLIGIEEINKKFSLKISIGANEKALEGSFLKNLYERSAEEKTDSEGNNDNE